MHTFGDILEDEVKDGGGVGDGGGAGGGYFGGNGGQERNHYNQF